MPELFLVVLVFYVACAVVVLSRDFWRGGPGR